MAAKPRSSFVKAASTTVDPTKSRAELEKMLTRYGAVGFSYAVDLEKGEIRVDFVVPDSAAKNATKVPVRLPISIRSVYDALYGRPQRWDGDAKKHVHNPKGYDARMLSQAERVAWRNLVLWIDAALSAAAIGVQTITEAFFAHTMVVDDGGRVERMVEYVMRGAGALAPGVRALIGSPKETADV
jgi:hypothetical protein